MATTGPGMLVFPKRPHRGPEAEFDRIDLSLCIGNQNGRLTGWEKQVVPCITSEHLLTCPSGNYLPTCGGCKTLRQKQDIKLSCNCFDNQGRRPGSSVDLSEYPCFTRSFSMLIIFVDGFIFNQDGTLGCYSNLGNKTLVGPKPTPS